MEYLGITKETIIIVWVSILVPLLILLTITSISSNRLKRKIMLVSKLRQKRLREEMDSVNETFRKYELPEDSKESP